jgi:glutathione S-transferase
MRVSQHFLFIIIAAITSSRLLFATATTCSETSTCTMSSHELMYFDGAGRAESIRILLYAAGVPFTDTRFKGAEWPTIKPTTPLGSVPVLKIDGIQHCQSVALMRYAAKLAGFYPEDPLEALAVDEIVDSINELMGLAPRSKDPEEFKKLRSEFQETTMKKFSDFIESIIQRNGGKLVVGKSVTMADIAVSQTVKSIESGSWDHIDSKFFASYPGMIAATEAVGGNEKIVAYYASKQE